jgi:hypothetical protein
VQGFCGKAPHHAQGLQRASDSIARPARHGDEIPRKGRNLARDLRCSLGVAAHEFDLAVDGQATLVTDPATVADLAARWAAEGWPPGRPDSPSRTANM